MLLAGTVLAGKENSIVWKNNKKNIWLLAAAALGTLALLVSLLTAMPGSALADGTVKISSDTGSFTAYRMFEGHVVGDRLYDPEFDTQVAPAGIWREITGMDAPSAEAALDWVRENVSAQPSKTANIIGNAFDASASGVPLSAGEEKVLPDGYYAITGSFKPIPFIILVGNGSVLDTVAKPTAPSLEKEVVSGQSWRTSSVAGVGKPISYRLVGKTSADYAEYDSYYFAFRDRADDSISIDAGSVKVFDRTASGEKDITGKATVSAGGSKLDVEFEDLASVIGGYDPERTIIVEYDAYLVEGKMKAGAAHPNMNSATVEYGEKLSLSGMGRTKEARTQSYSLVLEIVKTGNGKVLEGASFAIADTDGKYLGEDGWVDEASNAKVFTTGADGKASIAGLSDGVYYLTEVKAPEGYSRIEDAIPVTLTLKGQDEVVLSAATGHKMASVTAVDSAEGVASITVDNDKSGNTVPPDNENGNERNGKKDNANEPGKDKGDGNGDGDPLKTVGDFVSGIVPVLGEHPLVVGLLVFIIGASVAAVIVNRTRRKDSTKERAGEDDD